MPSSLRLKRSARARLRNAQNAANAAVLDRLDDDAVTRARIHLDQRASDPSDPVTAHQMKVFSQFGEDGMLDFLVRHAAAPVPRTFVEFGVEDYREANTRLLCELGGWRGLVIDGGSSHLRFVKHRKLGTHRGLRAVQSFLTTDNVDAVIASHAPAGPLGILSVDVDGVDYWLSQAITARPAIVVSECNPYFGSGLTVSIPDEPAFDRLAAHASGVYYGASVRALHDLWTARGYRLVAVSSEGLNLFFVHEDHCHPSWGLSVEAAYTAPSFSPSLTADGVPLAHLPRREALAPVADLPLVDTRTGERLRVADVLDRVDA